jgi:hypothetical protein
MTGVHIQTSTDPLTEHRGFLAHLWIAGRGNMLTNTGPCTSEIPPTAIPSGEVLIGEPI